MTLSWPFVVVFMGVSIRMCMQPETISNVFCKIDDKNQLECVVDVTYYHLGFELGPESENRCQTVSRDDYGDFCGA